MLQRSWLKGSFILGSPLLISLSSVGLMRGGCSSAGGGCSSAGGDYSSVGGGCGGGLMRDLIGCKIAEDCPFFSFFTFLLLLFVAVFLTVFTFFTFLVAFSTYFSCDVLLLRGLAVPTAPIPYSQSLSSSQIRVNKLSSQIIYILGLRKSGSSEIQRFRTTALINEKPYSFHWGSSLYGPSSLFCPLLWNINCII